LRKTENSSRRAFTSKAILSPQVLLGHRIDRILNYRRQLRQHVLSRFGSQTEMGKLAADAVLLLDFDVYGVDVKSILRQFKRGSFDRWDALCSHSLDHVGWYRDVFATVFDSGSWAFDKELRKLPDHVEYIAQPRHISPASGASSANVIPMRSCFGGLAIYHTETYLNTQCDYVNTSDALEIPSLAGYVAHDNVLCEHVPFHFCLADSLSARIGLAMDMSVTYEMPGLELMKSSISPLEQASRLMIQARIRAVGSISSSGTIV